MRLIRTRHLLSVALLALAALLGAPLASAQQGAVTGKVTDKSTGQPLVGAQVAVVGTTLRGLTTQGGSYRVAGLAPGTVTVRVAFIGYAAATQTATVTAGGSVELSFALVPSAVGLDAVVVTAIGNQAVREQGTMAHNLSVDSTAKKALPTNLSDALNSRLPGVVVQPAGGTTGTGTRIRIRGSNSVSLSNDPVLIVDGVRVENGSVSTSVGVGGQTPSRLNDISPQDLEAVEVASGPAASVLYGTDAANGVVQMETRRGQAGPTRWTVATEWGALNDIGGYPANYSGLTAANTGCTLTRFAEGTCVLDHVRTFNPLEVNSPFRTGHRQQYGVSASGGTEQTTFYVSGHYSNEDGVYPVNRNRQVNLLANLFNRATTKLDLQATVLYTSGRLRLPQNDNNVFGVLSSGFLGSSDSTVNKGYGFLTPTQSFSIRAFQNIDHFTGSLRLNYRPRSWLEAHAVVGNDFTNRYDENTQIPGAIPSSFNVSASQGSRAANPFQIYNWTGNFWGTASFALTPDLNSSTSAGIQYFHVRLHGVLASVQQLTAGTNSLAGGVIPTANEQTLETVTLGRFAEERLAYKDRVYVTGSLRSDKNSAFGEKFGNIVYPRFSASWVISQEPFFPTPGWLGSLRLRGAAGSSGLRPGPTDALQFFTSTPVVVGSQDVPGITFGSLGNSSLKPERTSETEAGFDVELRPMSTHLAFTYYSKLSHDALVAVPLPPSCGCGNAIFRNLGSVSNKGVEISASATVLQTRNLGIEVNATAWGNRSRVRTLGQGIAPIIFGLGGATQRITPGFAPGSYFQVPYTYSDANGDGLIDTNEVKLGTAPVFIGQPLPDHGGSVNATFTLFERWHLYGLLDGRFGNKLFNSTEQFRCGLGNCQGRNDPKATLAQQAAAVANIKGTQAGFMEDAGFVKLREVSLTYDAPTAWAARLGAASLSVTIAGRNLIKWTNYTGLDPELNEAGQANFTTADFLTQPPVRYWIGRVNLTF
jgi:TonB-dependent starch-binding outer membrane protein SusC